MGRSTEYAVGVGATLREAERNAIEEYLFENGHRCHIDKSTVTSHERVPPMKWERRMQGRIFGQVQVPDTSVPAEKWGYKAHVELVVKS